MRPAVPVVALALFLLGLLAAPASRAAGPDPIADLSATDRAVQMAAVEALVARPDDPGPELVQLWKATGRADVRVMIARVLAGRAGDGLEHILALGERPAVETGDGDLELLGWAAARHGPGVLTPLMEAVDARRASANMVALYAIEELGLDRHELGVELAQGASPPVTLFALGLLLYDAPPEVRGPLVVRMAKSQDPQLRRMAGRFLPWWTDAEREAMGELHRACVDAAIALLRDEDEQVRKNTVVGLASFEAPPAALGPVLLEMIERGERWDPQLPSPMVVYLFVERTPEAQRAAVGLVVGKLGESPEEVLEALRAADPALLDAELLRGIMRDLTAIDPPTGGALGDLLAVRGTEDGPPLGAAVLDELARWVSEGDRSRAFRAASILGRMGPHARPAIDELLALLATTRPGFGDDGLVETVLEIAPGDERVAAALTERVRVAVERPRTTHQDRRLMGSLARLAGDQPWAQRVLGPIVRDPRLLKRWDLRPYPWPGMAELFAEDPSAHVAAVGHAPVLAAMRADPASGDVDQRLAALAEETAVRGFAARALGLLEEPPAGAIDALTRVLTDGPPVHRGGWPPEQDGPADPLERALRATTTGQYEFTRAAANALARLLGRGPERVGGVIDALEGSPEALAIVLSTPIGDLAVPGFELLTVPPDVGEGCLSIALDALLARAEFFADAPWELHLELLAIGRLPTDDPRALGMLLREARFGTRVAARQRAIEALGEVRPVEREAIEELRRALAGPPDGRRRAALDACEALGPESGPLLNEVLALAQREFPVWLDGRAVEVLGTIAPEDERVRAILERADGSGDGTPPR